MKSVTIASGLGALVVILLMLLTAVVAVFFLKKGTKLKTATILLRSRPLVETCIRFLFLLVQVHFGNDTYTKGS